MLTLEEEVGVVYGNDDSLQTVHSGYIHLGQSDIVFPESGRDGEVEHPLANQFGLDCLLDMGTAQQQHFDVLHMLIHILSLVGIDIGTEKQCHLNDATHQKQ